MFINKATNGSNNLCGKQVAHFRMELGISQRELADKLQLIGIDIDKNAIQRIECGKRFVTDIEIVALAKAFEVALEELLFA
ncbi:MAG: helix-turn-helix transcriptional regulator [Clostridia bacterium]|nr:helix-turn-helix transcriptional regulator [Clostridia bacterium]